MNGFWKSPWPVRVGLALVVCIYLVYCSFGIAAPFWWGHYGYHGAQYLLRARLSLRLHTIYPITWSGWEPGPLNALYFHHPIGLHHLLTLTVPIFGDHEWLARLVGVTGGLASMWALYRLVARYWSRELGLCAVTIYVALPVVTSFSILCDAMFIEMACVLVGLHAYLSLLEQPTKRAIWQAAIASAVGGLFMWEVFFIAPFVAVHALVYSRSPRGRTLRLGNWNALILHTAAVAVACIVVLAFHFYLTHHSGAWPEFIEAYKVRKGADPHWVVDQHVKWITILYGWPPVVVGMMWLVAFTARVLTSRVRRRDLAVLTFFYINSLYIVMFAEGSAVHLYRVYFYSVFFTLALVDLLYDLGRGLERLGARRWQPAVAVVAVLGIYLWAEVPHAYDNLLESRVMMGTHGEGGYNPRRELTRFSQEVHARTTKNDRVIVHYGHLGARKEMWYYIDRNFDEITTLSDAQLARFEKTLPQSVLMLDERMLNVAERPVFEKLVAKHPVTFFDRFALVDLRSQKPGETSYMFVDGKMTPGYRWWVSHKYKPLELKRAASLSTLCRLVALGVPMASDEAEPPTPPANELAIQQCWYNYLAARGDTARAAQVRSSLGAGLNAVDVPLGHAQVVAAGVTQRHLRVLWVAGGPEVGEVRYHVKRAGQPDLFIPRSVAPPPSEWVKGQLYADEVFYVAGTAPPELTVELVVPPPPAPTPPKPATPPPAPPTPPLPPKLVPKVVPAPGRPGVMQQPPKPVAPAAPPIPPPPPMIIKGQAVIGPLRKP